MSDVEFRTIFQNWNVFPGGQITKLSVWRRSGPAGECAHVCQSTRSVHLQFTRIFGCIEHVEVAGRIALHCGLEVGVVGFLHLS